MTSVTSSRGYIGSVPKMPPGLVELMEGLAKEALKCNPTDVYAFCAKHMQKLLEIRDGSPPKRILTLEQKIAMANKKVRERAAERRKDYDNKMKMIKPVLHQNNEKDEVTIIDDINYTHAGQYVENNIVKIPEEYLCGNIEHEIIPKMKERSSSSEPEKPSEIDIENTPKDAISDNIGESILKPESNNITNEVKAHENMGDIRNLKAMKENITNEASKNGTGKQQLLIVSEHTDAIDNEKLEIEENKSLESVAKFENDISSPQHCFTTLIKNQNQIKEIFDRDDEKNSEEEKKLKREENNFNNNEGINYVSVNDGEPKYINDFKPNDDVPMYDSDHSKNVDTAKVTLHSTMGEQSSCDDNDELKNHIYLHLPEEQKDDQKINTASVQPEETEIVSTKYIESQSHINNTSMDLETAAITIQKVFRSFLFRNKTSSTDDATNVDINLLMEDKEIKDDSDISAMNVNKDRRSLGLSRIDSVLQTVNEEKSLSLSTDDSSTLSSAATVIQAHVRGFLARNKFNVNKNSSTTSGVDSDGLSFTSIEGENDNRKNKTILNIHIVPESGHFMTRDESVLTSMDLSLDGSPPSSTNLHPLGYDRNERRKQLKREDAIQSISPPTNNSGKLSEEIDSVKEVFINSGNSNDENPDKLQIDNSLIDEEETVTSHFEEINDFIISPKIDNLDTALEVKSLGPIESPVKYLAERPQSLPEMTSDEMDVITPYTPVEEKESNDSKNVSNLIHSGEFHDVVLPTKVSRSDTSVVRGE